MPMAVCRKGRWAKEVRISMTNTGHRWTMPGRDDVLTVAPVRVDEWRGRRRVEHDQAGGAEEMLMR